MKVTLSQIGSDAHFYCKTPENQSIQIHAPLNKDTEKVAPSPMQTLLMAAAACSAVDVLLILGKMKQPVEHLEIDVEGNRVELESSKPFEAINLTFKITGNVDEKKANRAVKLSVEKYCSVLDSMNPNLQRNYNVQIINL